MAGWIKLHRSLQQNWIWEDKPFSKGQAWVDLLMMVNHDRKTVNWGGEPIPIEKGTCITSIRKLGERWGWSNSKVNRFLSCLESDEMLVAKKDSKKTTLTILKWDVYQCDDIAKKTVKEQTKNRQRTDKHTNKNDKNEKNDKKYIVIQNVDNVKLTQEQYNSLIGEFGKPTVDSKILDMDNYVTQKNKPYKDYNKALRTWLRKDNTDTKKGEEDERERLYGF